MKYRGCSLSCDVCTTDRGHRHAQNGSRRFDCRYYIDGGDSCTTWIHRSHEGNRCSRCSPSRSPVPCWRSPSAAAYAVPPTLDVSPKPPICVTRPGTVLASVNYNLNGADKAIPNVRDDTDPA